MEHNTFSTPEKLKNGYESLLLGYASGTLDEAQSLAVATHLTFSTTARQFIGTCEAIGGALIESECTKESMNAESLDNVLDRLDNLPPTPKQEAKTETFKHDDFDFSVPAPLANQLQSQNITWKTLLSGFHSLNIDLNCEDSKARLLKIAPGTKSPHHSHGGTEITLVLDGAFSDETGQYKTGDLIVTDETFTHAPIACKLQGCTCLVVSTAPIKLKGMASLLNPFLKP